MTATEEIHLESERIATLLSAADADAADALLHIAETTTSKESRKAARRALYLLSQKHITPSAPVNRGASAPVSQFRKAPVAFVAYGSSVDGAGNRMISVAFTEPDNGSPTLYQILVNDEVGIKDYFTERISRRALQNRAEILLAQIDSGIAIAEIEVDYALQLIHDTREINRSLGTQSPPGFLDVLEAIGEPKEQISVSAVHDNLYTIYSKEDLQNDISFSASPEAFFTLLWFEPWFMPAEDMVPWLEAAFDGEFGAIGEGAKSADAGANMIHTAASILMDRELCDRYIYRLEASADILHRRGKTMEARFALYHAQQLREKAHRSAFALSLIDRTTMAAIQMRTADQQMYDPALLDSIDPAILEELDATLQNISDPKVQDVYDPNIIGVIHPTDSASEAE